MLHWRLLEENAVEPGAPVAGKCKLQGVFLHSTHCAVAFSAQYIFFRKKNWYKIEVSAE
jgi:hypothetical protein